MDMDEDEIFKHYPKAPVRQIKDPIYDQSNRIHILIPLTKLTSALVPISPTLSRFIDTYLCVHVCPTIKEY